MHQDIQTFSDTLDINPKLKVTLTLQIHGHVAYSFTVNGKRCYEGANYLEFDLLDRLSLKSEIVKLQVGTSAVEVTEFSVNGYNVLPIYQHRSSSKNCYHDWVGSWSMDINEPFYPWYHNVSGQGWIA